MCKKKSHQESSVPILQTRIMLELPCLIQYSEHRAFLDTEHLPIRVIILKGNSFKGTSGLFQLLVSLPLPFTLPPTLPHTHSHTHTHTHTHTQTATAIFHAICFANFEGTTQTLDIIMISYFSPIPCGNKTAWASQPSTCVSIHFLHLPTLSWRWSQHQAEIKPDASEGAVSPSWLCPTLCDPEAAYFPFLDECSSKHRPKIFVKSKQITSLASSLLIWLPTMSLKKWNWSARIYTLWGLTLSPWNLFPSKGFQTHTSFFNIFFK